MARAMTRLETPFMFLIWWWLHKILGHRYGERMGSQSYILLRWPISESGIRGWLVRIIGRASLSTSDLASIECHSQKLDTFESGLVMNSE